MLPVDKETNIEVLRKYTLWLETQVKDLSKELTKIRNNKELSKQEWLDAKLKDQLTRYQELIYGFGRETLPREDRPVGHEDEQLKLHGEYPQEGKVLPKERLENFTGPVKFVHGMSDNELSEESVLREIETGSEAWEEVPGLYQDSQEIRIFQRVYKKVLVRQLKYKLKPQFNKTGKEVILTAPGPAKVKPGSKYGIDFAVSVAVDKFLYHIPLERQRRQMQASGLDVEVKTLYGLTESVAEHCQVVLPLIRQDILNDFCSGHLDETTWPILGNESQSYMWVLSNRCGAYYQFEPTRSGQIAEEILKNHKGSVLTDGYGGYNRIKATDGLRVAHCWSHVRREFYDRRRDYPVEATQALKIIDKLFKVEAEAKNFGELKEKRAKESKLIIKAFEDWMMQTIPKHLPESGIIKAIAYCSKFWKELTHFLKDLSVPLSNNDAERAMRSVVMGRKNFGGSKTINGADTAAALYTVIETCKRVGLQPKDYLEYLIDAKWFGDPIQSPLQHSLGKQGLNKKVQFPKKDNWKI